MLLLRALVFRSAVRSSGLGGTDRPAASRHRKIGGHKPRLLAGELRDWLLERSKSDFTLRGLVAELAERGVKVDYVQVWRFAHAEGLSFKKKRSSRRTAETQGRQTPSAVEEVPGPA